MLCAFSIVCKPLHYFSIISSVPVVLLDHYFMIDHRNISTIRLHTQQKNHVCSLMKPSCLSVAFSHFYDFVKPIDAKRKVSMNAFDDIKEIVKEDLGDFNNEIKKVCFR